MRTVRTVKLRCVPQLDEPVGGGKYEFDMADGQMVAARRNGKDWPAGFENRFSSCWVAALNRIAELENQAPGGGEVGAPVIHDYASSYPYTMFAERVRESAHRRTPPDTAGELRPVHHLKVWPEFFEALVSRQKQFEIRKDDRGYMVGDSLILSEFFPCRGPLKEEVYSGRSVTAWVTYIVRGGRFGLAPDYVVMGLGDMRGP